MANLKGYYPPGNAPAQPGSTYTDLKSGTVYIQTGEYAFPIWTILVDGTLRSIAMPNKITESGSTSGSTGTTLSGTTGLTSTTTAVISVVPIKNFKLSIDTDNSTQPIVVRSSQIRSTSFFVGSINQVSSTQGSLLIKDITANDGWASVIVANVGTQAFNGNFTLVLQQII
jgi:hypothetical protein